VIFWKAGIRIRDKRWPQRRKVCLKSGRKPLAGLRHSGIQHWLGNIGNYGSRRLTTVPTIAIPSNEFFTTRNALILCLLFPVWERAYPGQPSSSTSQRCLMHSANANETPPIFELKHTTISCYLTRMIQICPPNRNLNAN
jgi:hypothetical protein